MPKIDNRIGTIIREARHTKGFTQDDLSQISGLSVKTISNIERGAQESRFENLERLIEVLEIPREMIFPKEYQPLSPNALVFMDEFQASDPIVREIVACTGMALIKHMEQHAVEYWGAEPR